MVIDKLIYRRDGGGYVEDGYRQLFVLSAEGGTPRQLTTDEFHHDGPPSWDPSGESLVFSANRHPDWRYRPLDSEVYGVRLADGEIRALTDRRGPDDSPVVSPDGEHIAYLGFDDRHQGYQVTRLHVMNRDGGEPRALTGALDRSVEAPMWSADGRGVYFAYSDRGNGRIGRVSLGGEVEELAADVGGTALGRPYSSGSFTVAGDGRLAYTMTRPDHPADVAVGRPGAEVRRVTRLNDDLFGHKELEAVEEIWWPSSHDGRRIQG